MNILEMNLSSSSSAELSDYYYYSYYYYLQVCIHSVVQQRILNSIFLSLRNDGDENITKTEKKRKEIITYEEKEERESD
jgi:hypothetical protein